MSFVERGTPIHASEARNVDTPRSDGQHQVRYEIRFLKGNPNYYYATHGLGNECSGSIDPGYDPLY